LQVCDLALIHVNSTVNGYWTDVTRTYSVEIPTSEGKRVLTAIQVARSAALDKIRPGVLARDVDHAARKVLEEGGSGKAFRHPLGHGVGFSAFDHSAKPCLSPYSKDVLEPGMIFNVEPGIYLENRLGARHCDMVEVTSDGYRVLTEGV
jgi:Xaa-Pro dipeptidase